MMKLKNPAVGILLLRIALAIVFISHGVGKLTNIEMTTGFFDKIGVWSPAFMSWVVGLVETVGGLALLVGFGTFIAGIALAVTMLFAIILAKSGRGLSGMEFELTLLLASLGIALHGPGKYSFASISKTSDTTKA